MIYSTILCINGIENLWWIRILAISTLGGNPLLLLIKTGHLVEACEPHLARQIQEKKNFKSFQLKKLSPFDCCQVIGSKAINRWSNTNFVYYIFHSFYIGQLQHPPDLILFSFFPWMAESERHFVSRGTVGDPFVLF